LAGSLPFVSVEFCTRIKTEVELKKRKKEKMKKQWRSNAREWFYLE